MSQRRQLTINWHGDETQDYEALAAEALKQGLEISDYAKERLRQPR